MKPLRPALACFLACIAACGDDASTPDPGQGTSGSSGYSGTPGQGGQGGPGGAPQGGGGPGGAGLAGSGAGAAQGGAGQAGAGVAGGAGQGGAGAAGGAAQGGASGATASCGEYASGLDFKVCTATYLAGPGKDAVTAVDVGQDGSVLVAATLPGQNLGAAPVALAGGTDGAVIRLDSGGTKVLSLARIGARVTDLQVDLSTGNVAVSGDFGAALLDPTATKLLWAQATPGGEAKRVSAAGGSVAALAGKQVTIFDGAGALVKTIDIGGKEVNDLVLDGVNKAVAVTGYKQDDGDKCSQYKSTFLRSFNLDGSPRWTNYDWTKADVGASGDCADSTGIALALGRDGKLYYAGKSDGGNTVHQKDPRDLSKKAPLVGNDPFNQPYGFKGANSIGFYARFSLADGLIDKGQFIVARKGDGGPSAEGNAATPAAIAADEDGNVFVAGTAAFRIEGLDQKSVGGQKIGPYSSYEGFLLIASPDLEKRLSWTSFTATGPADGRAVAASGKLGVYAASQSAEQAGKGALITASPLVGAPAGGDDGYLVVFPAP